jgi:hypothetical protein
MPYFQHSFWVWQGVAQKAKVVSCEVMRARVGHNGFSTYNTPCKASRQVQL